MICRKAFSINMTLFLVFFNTVIIYALIYTPFIHINHKFDNKPRQDFIWSISIDALGDVLPLNCAVAVNTSGFIDE